MNRAKYKKRKVSPRPDKTDKNLEQDKIKMKTLKTEMNLLLSKAEKNAFRDDMYS